MKRGIDVIKFIYRPVDIKTGEPKKTTWKCKDCPTAVKGERAGRLICLVCDMKERTALTYHASMMAAEKHPEIFADWETAKNYDIRKIIGLMGYYREKLIEKIEGDVEKD